MGNKSAKSSDPANCLCQKSDFKFKWCSCGRSKPSNEPPEKIRFWIDPEKIQKGVRYNALEIPDHAKTDKDNDPKYKAFVRELQTYSNQIYRDSKPEGSN